MTQTKAQKSGSWTPQIQKKAPSLAPPPIVVQRDAIAAPTSEAPLPEYTPLEPNALQNHPLMGNISDLPPIQTKLTIGAPGDKYEQEADTIARKVVSQINSPTAQAKPATKVLQRQPVGRDITVSPFAGMMQAKEAIAGGPASQDLESSINRAKGGGQPLDAGLQQSMGQAMGADFSGVRVHTDANSNQLNQSIQAKAFTTGQDVFFKQGEYNPGSKDGQELIAHELTHTIQQGGGQIHRKFDGYVNKLNKSLKVNTVLGNSVVQAKLMTGSELEALTGKKQRNVAVRGIKAIGGLVGIGKGGSSYDDIITALNDYEKLEKTDQNGKKINQRLLLLNTLENKILEWYSSENRQKDAQGEVIAKEQGDEGKISFLQDLMIQVLDERDKLQNFGLNPDLVEKTRNIKADSQITNSQETYSEKEAKQNNQKSKSFFAKVGDFFKYAFANDLNPDEVVALKPEIISEYDIGVIIELIEASISVEQKLLADGVSPLKATALAYQYLPGQIRPKSPEESEKIILKVKLQSFKEAKDVITETQQKLGQPTKTLKEKITDAAKNLFVPEELTVGGFTEKAGDLTDKAGSVVGNVGKASKYLGASKDTQDSFSNISDGMSAVAAPVSSFGKILKSLEKITDNKTSEFEAMKAEGEANNEVFEFMKSVYAALGTFDQMATGAEEVNPIFSVISNVIDILKNLYQGGQKLYRAFQENKLTKKAEKLGSALKDTFASTAKRSWTLVVRTGVDIVISALDILSTVLAPVQGAGVVLKAITSVIKIGNTVGKMLHDSYRTGVAQEAKLQAEAGMEGSGKKLLELDNASGITATILEAKDGNQLALEKLNLYGITRQMLGEASVKEIREYIMQELQDQENAATLTQKVLKGNNRGQQVVWY